MDLSDCDYHHNKLELYRKRLGDARKMHIETEKAIKRLEEEIIRKCNNIQRWECSKKCVKPKKK